jgi:hypothetical protein
MPALLPHGLLPFHMLTPGLAPTTVQSQDSKESKEAAATNWVPARAATRAITANCRSDKTRGAALLFLFDHPFFFKKLARTWLARPGMLLYHTFMLEVSGEGMLTLTAERVLKEASIVVWYSVGVTEVATVGEVMPLTMILQAFIPISEALTNASLAAEQNEICGVAKICCCCCAAARVTRRYRF